MGCTTSVFSDTVAASGVIDLSLAHGVTDAEAVVLSRTIHTHSPISLRMPRFACPSAKLSGDGLSQLCIAGAGSLTTVELNEAALPRVTAAAAAQALCFLGDLREVSIRGASWPRRILSILGDHTTMPLTTVRTVLLGGTGVDSTALAALPKAFPCCTGLYLQAPDTAWASALPSLVVKGVLFTHVNRFVVDSPVHLDSGVAKAVDTLCPQLAHRHFASPSLVETADSRRESKCTIIRSPRSIEAQVRFSGSLPRFTSAAAAAAMPRAAHHAASGVSPLVALATPHHDRAPEPGPTYTNDLRSPSMHSAEGRSCHVSIIAPGEDPPTASPVRHAVSPPLRSFAVAHPGPHDSDVSDNPLEQAPSERSVSMSQSLQDMQARSCSPALMSLSIGTMDSVHKGHAPPPLTGFIRPRPQGGYVRAAASSVTAEAARSVAACVVRTPLHHSSNPPMNNGN